MNTDPYY